MKRLLYMPTVALAALLLAFSPAAATATDGFASGTDLKGWCENMELDDIHWGLCVGSITAGHDIIMTYQEADAANEVVCTTMAHTRADVVFSVIEYLNENHGDLGYSLGDVLLSALIDKFPCSTDQ